MRRPTLTLLAFVLAGLSASPAQAEGVYWTTESVLKSFFPDSEKVTYETIVTARHTDTLRAQLDALPAKERYFVFVARTGEQIDGYAVIDTEMGQHRPITFGIKISPDGKVERTEVMAYREAYGEGIRHTRFRKQFLGKRSGDPLDLGHDISAVTGATISARSATRVVRRALVLVGIVRGRGPARATATSARSERDA